MTSSRILEAIKRLLMAETYIRSREKAEECEPKAAAPKDKETRRLPDVGD